jgi:hypothetical protein
MAEVEAPAGKGVAVEATAQPGKPAVARVD